MKSTALPHPPPNLDVHQHGNPSARPLTAQTTSPLPPPLASTLAVAGVSNKSKLAPKESSLEKGSIYSRNYWIRKKALRRIWMSPRSYTRARQMLVVH